MELLLGMDLGSTTVKLVALHPGDQSIAYSIYRRHHASFAAAAADILADFHAQFPGVRCRMAICGSAGQGAAEECQVPYIQEVVAASMAVNRFHAGTRTVIELGGQDAKVVFFASESAVEMRMNGSCAGGTGAFIDQIADLLGVPVEAYDTLSSTGRQTYPISGRCGVFARTDIQPLLNQGARKADLALSALHAVVKQTLGGLAQGRTIHSPVLFLGGPCTFIPNLPRVFQEHLGFSDREVKVPDGAEVLVACGAALSIEELFTDTLPICLERKIEVLRKLSGRNLSKSVSPGVDGARERPGSVHLGWPGSPNNGKGQRSFFESPAEQERFLKNSTLPVFTPSRRCSGTLLPVYIGLDAGSTTSKFAVLDENGELVDRFYAGNSGEPLEVMREGLSALFNRYRSEGVDLEVLATGATGYGEKLFASAFKTDVNTVETVAHAEAARHYCPDASFILDIGGQDMKAIFLNDGIITGITLNEACSAGCGSFLENYAASLGVELDDLAALAFRSDHPSELGSRCTVFMNSSIITEQKRGRTAPDILAGLCRSIVENVFTKVLRISNLHSLGRHIVVQGGTFKNDAVLRAFEQHVGRPVIRPSYPGEMGAIGAALLARKAHLRSGNQTTFITPEDLETFKATRHSGVECPLCNNHCNRILVDFGEGRYFLTGNRCERGSVLTPADAKARLNGRRTASIPDAGLTGNPETSPGIRPRGRQTERPRDLMAELPALLARDWRQATASDPDREETVRIGIPRVLGMIAWMPFWTALFRELGMVPIISPNSSEGIFERGLANVPSDTVCLPAKLVHGHVSKLLDMGVDRLFLPEFIAMPRENENIPGTCVCALVQAYATVIQSADDPEGRFGIPFDKPVLFGHSQRLLDKQLHAWLQATFALPSKLIRRALGRANQAFRTYKSDIQRRGRELLDALTGDEFAVVLAGRPYHSDPYVNHRVSRLFTQLGVAVLPLEAVPGVDAVDLAKVRVECHNSLHSRLLAGAHLVSEDPRLEMAQLTSFGCGHEAILSDEVSRILKETGDRELLVLKLDEGDVTGPLTIRIRSFIETVRSRREAQARKPSSGPIRGLEAPYKLRFEKKDKNTRTILVPTLSEGFSELVASIFTRQGFKIKVLAPADHEAVQLGKCNVHNDICFPAQINVGEALKFLQKHRKEGHRYALGLAKNCGNCRAGQYAVLARKALDEAGFPDVAILTTGSDIKDMHPGFRVGPSFGISMVWGMFLVDAMERMLRALRPYETMPGRSKEVFRTYLKPICDAVPRSHRDALGLLARAVDEFNAVDTDRRTRKPRVGILGEVLVKYHPTATAGLQTYLEANGMEIVQPDMIDFFRRNDPIRRDKTARGFEPHPWLSSLLTAVCETIYGQAWNQIHPIAQGFKYHEEHSDCYGLMNRISKIFDKSFQVGEGWLIAAEILDMFDRGVDSFVILQPFGCIPNHISGRGVARAIQKEAPNAQIVALDFDPDTPFANVENRLQMLIWNAKRKARSSGRPPETQPDPRTDTVSRVNGSRIGEVVELQ